MAMHLYKTTELQLLQSFVNQSLSTDFEFRFSTKDLNYIVFLISDKIAGMFRIISLISSENERFLYEVENIRITMKKNRKSFPFFNFFISDVVEDHESIQKIVSYIEELPYDFGYYHINADDILQKEEQRLKRQKQSAIPIDSKSINNDYGNISEPHIKAQYILKHLAHAINLDCFIAKNDHHRLYENEGISNGTCSEFPNYDLPLELTNHLSLIDTIWFNDQIPVAAFEVEITSSVSSGILRIADLLCTLDTHEIEMYIITTKQRQNKIKKELNRPVFQRLGISQKCKVVFLEDLEHLFELTSQLSGYIKGNILDKISYDYADVQQFV